MRLLTHVYGKALELRFLLLLKKALVTLKGEARHQFINHE